MDILRKELDEIYRAQSLESERLSSAHIAEARGVAETSAWISNGCAVITDAASDSCYIYSGAFGRLMGFANENFSCVTASSSDEDIVYDLIHPEDLVDKRFLEYEFFKLVDSLSAEEKIQYIAKCRLRMRDENGHYRPIDNTTQLLTLSPNGKIWLILCTYTLSADLSTLARLSPAIINTATGKIIHFTFDKLRKEVLSKREKEILLLIRDGKPSKQIADILGISIHTVNRHRQNIIEKLNVGNSTEAVSAAMIMKLL